MYRAHRPQSIVAMPISVLRRKPASLHHGGRRSAIRGHAGAGCGRGRKAAVAAGSLREDPRPAQRTPKN